MSQGHAPTDAEAEEIISVESPHHMLFAAEMAKPFIALFIIRLLIALGLRGISVKAVFSEMYLAIILFIISVYFIAYLFSYAIKYYMTDKRLVIFSHLKNKEISRRSSMSEGDVSPAAELFSVDFDDVEQFFFLVYTKNCCGFFFRECAENRLSGSVSLYRYGMGWFMIVFRPLSVLRLRFFALRTGRPIYRKLTSIAAERTTMRSTS